MESTCSVIVYDVLIKVKNSVMKHIAGKTHYHGYYIA